MAQYRGGHENHGNAQEIISRKYCVMAFYDFVDNYRSSLKHLAWGLAFKSFGYKIE